MFKPVDRARFNAYGGDGTTYPVRAYQMRDDSLASAFDRPSNDPADWTYETTDARVVLRIAKGEYLITGFGTRVVADRGP